MSAHLIGGPHFFHRNHPPRREGNPHLDAVDLHPVEGAKRRAGMPHPVRSILNEGGLGDFGSKGHGSAPARSQPASHLDNHPLRPVKHRPMLEPVPPDAGEFPCDVFISYSSGDKDWVRGELLSRIEQAGLKAFLDFRDFKRGAPSIKEMERGVVECRKTLLILTPDYIASEWCEIESIMGQTLSPANRDLRLIPLLKAECKKPLRIGALTHIDFTPDADHALAWRQLLTALGAPPPQEPPREPERSGWFLAHPYPMPPNFTGRIAERAQLDRWLGDSTGVPLLCLQALGGFGKSALVWHWLTHDVAPAQWPRLVWWSFYEGDASFDHFLAETLAYLSRGTLDVAKLPAKTALDALLKELRQPGTLLILDGFERVLRLFGGLDAAYRGDDVPRADGDHDCISPVADTFLRHVAALPQLRSKVLLTTRLRPRAIEARGELLDGAREVPLRQMQPPDAVEFFRAQGIRGTHTEIEAACAPYGYHPLSLRLLAGWIVRDLQQPGDIAAARRLDVSGDQVQRQNHVLQVAYDSLAPARRELLGRIACFRSPVDYQTLHALAESGENSAAPLDADLRDLVARGLVHRDLKENRFDLHPIVRRYAYDRLAAPERDAAHTRLRDYFAAVPPVEKVTRLGDLAPVTELYHHTVRAGQFDEAVTLFRDRLATPLYYQLGAYQLRIDLLLALFPDGEAHSASSAQVRLPRLKDESDQAWTLNALANSYSLSGQPRRAVQLFEGFIAISEKRDDKTNLAVGLGNVASMAQIHIGALRAAEANLRRRIALCREIKDEFRETVGHQELGRLLACRGEYAESETELEASTAYWKKTNDIQGQCMDEAYRAQRELLRLRSAQSAAERNEPDSRRRPGGPGATSICNPPSTLASASRALELADETANDSRFVYPVRDYARAHWLLGAAHRVAGEHDEAERHLHEALERCRRINLVDHEADILIDLARLRAATGAPDEAQRLADEAREIAERSGYVLQGAAAHLELAKLALVRLSSGSGTSSADLARHHATEAHRLATCDGPPDFTYAAAYAEATALLAQLLSQPAR